MEKSLVELSADIVQVQAGYQVMSPQELTEGLEKAFRVLQELHLSSLVEERELGGLSGSLAYLRKYPLKTIQRNHIICLESGKTYQQLSNKHLALYGLTSRAYKQKWGIPMGQPLSARSLTLRRRKVAKALGMGEQLAAWRAQRRGPARGVS